MKLTTIALLALLTAAMPHLSAAAPATPLTSGCPFIGNLSTRDDDDDKISPTTIDFGRSPPQPCIESKFKDTSCRAWMAALIEAEEQMDEHIRQQLDTVITDDTKSLLDVPGVDLDGDGVRDDRILIAENDGEGEGNAVGPDQTGPNLGNWPGADNNAGGVHDEKDY